MLQFPNIKPYIVKIGSFQIRWYGVMYLIGFISSYLLVRREVVRRNIPLSRVQVESLYFHIILGLILGARFGYVIFYNFSYYIRHPLESVAVWQGGMSFHGGLIGVVIAGFLFSRKNGVSMYTLGDLLMPTAPIGLFCGRIGNFINGELFGRPTDVPWGMVFPGGGPIPRHPSQLYEAFLEGIVLFTILWTLRDRFKKEGMITALFLILYGLFRFIVEYFREPDAHLGFVIGSFSMGQVLSSAMIVIGIAIFMAKQKQSTKNYE